MLVEGKPIVSYLGFGVLAFLGTALLQIPSHEYSTHAQSATPTTTGELHYALTEFDGVYAEAYAEFAPSIHSFADATTTFVDTNATTGRLQLEGMANSLSYSAHGSWLINSLSSDAHDAPPQSQSSKLVVGSDSAPGKSINHLPGPRSLTRTSPSNN